MGRRRQTRDTLDAARFYSLAELIDLAEGLDPADVDIEIREDYSGHYMEVTHLRDMTVLEIAKQDARENERLRKIVEAGEQARRQLEGGA